METRNNKYEAPQVEIIEVAVEKGYAQSESDSYYMPIDPNGSGDAG